MMAKIIRKHNSQFVVLDHLMPCGTFKECYTARAYERTGDLSKYIGRCSIDGDMMGDIGQQDLSGKALDKAQKEVYRLVDFLFPELINKGLKADGYVKFTPEEISKAGLQF